MGSSETATPLRGAKSWLFACAMAGVAIGLGFAPFFGPEEGFARVVEIGPEFYVTLPNDQADDTPGNRLSQQVTAVVANHPAFTREQILGQPQILVFRRVRPLVGSSS